MDRGEDGVGEWSIVVKDTNVNDHNGTFVDWRIKFFGECKDAENQEPFPMPTEHDDDDHDIISGSPTFISIDPSKGQPTSLPANPSDHQDRPVNVKPTATATQSSLASSGVASVTSTALPDRPPETDKGDEHFLPHLFPTFGVSKRTQIWIYGAVGSILLFCAGLGIYLFVQRRKRRRSEREDYEFEELLDEDANGHVENRQTKRRAGELYDAFAGGSEDEDEGLLSEDDAGELSYRDEPADELDEKLHRENPGP